MPPNIIEELIQALLAKQTDLAVSAMRYPDANDPKITAGKWQGIGIALDTINEILMDQPEDK